MVYVPGGPFLLGCSPMGGPCKRGGEHPVGVGAPERPLSVRGAGHGRERSGMNRDVARPGLYGGRGVRSSGEAIGATPRVGEPMGKLARAGAARGIDEDCAIVRRTAEEHGPD